MANLTVTVPDDKMADLAAAVGSTDADTMAKQKPAATAWLVEHTRTVLWNHQKNEAANAVADPMPEQEDNDG